MEKRSAEEIVSEAISIYNSAGGGMSGLFRWRESINKNYEAADLIYQYVSLMNFSPDTGLFYLGEKQEKTLVEMIVKSV